MTIAQPILVPYPKNIMLRDGTEVIVRPLTGSDKTRLLQFFQRVPEEDRYYLKENVTSPEMVQSWTADIDLERVIPLVALEGDKIIADATLHRSRAPARRHVGELRIVVDPAYREVGLGRRLIRELLDVAADLGLQKVTFELVGQREDPAIIAAESVGFTEVASLKERVRDLWGNYLDLVLMEMPIEKHRVWW
ncbi:MAG: GNAT family N-acetyltransferase [Dehalococcoidia bacterium]